jgi:hypothetical protein
VRDSSENHFADLKSSKRLLPVGARLRELEYVTLVTNGCWLPFVQMVKNRNPEAQVPSRELWDQSGAVRFKFATDRDFDRYLIARCQFGLPKSATGQAR